MKTKGKLTIFGRGQKSCLINLHFCFTIFVEKIMKSLKNAWETHGQCPVFHKNTIDEYEVTMMNNDDDKVQQLKAIESMMDRELIISLEQREYFRSNHPLGIPGGNIFGAIE